MRLYHIITYALVVLSPHALLAGDWPSAAQHVPATARAALFFEPLATAGETSAIGSVAGVVGRMFDAGLLGEIGPQHALLIDALRALPLVAEYPHVLILHDVHLRAVGTHSSRLDRLAVSLVVLDGGDHRALAARISGLLKRHTTSATARLTTVREGTVERHTLTDSRLPEWAQIHWGPRGTTYHIGIGRRAQPPAIDVGRRTVAALTADEFVKNAQHLTAAADARVVLFVNWAAVLDGVGQRAAGRARAILQALGVAPQRTLWVGRSRGRALCLDMVQERAGGMQHTTLTAPLDGRDEARLVPAAATWYARLSASGAEIIQRCAAVYVAAHRRATREALAAGWSALDTQEGAALEELLLRPLDGLCIVHNAPPHAVLPALLATIRLDITGESAGVQRAVDVVMTHFAAYLARHTGWFRPQLHRSPEGWWYSQLGVYGPALAVTDHAVFITHSLPALRSLVPTAAPAAHPRP